MSDEATPDQPQQYLAECAAKYGALLVQMQNRRDFLSHATSIDLDAICIYHKIKVFLAGTHQTKIIEAIVQREMGEALGSLEAKLQRLEIDTKIIADQSIHAAQFEEPD